MNRENFRILIVDDDKSFLFFMTKILEGEGYTVRPFADPEEALRVIDTFQPNLIISDLKMPKIDGIAFMDEARRDKEIDFIMITAFATVETAVTAMKEGATDYIIKPLKDPDQLRIAVAKVFDRQTLIGENALLKSVLLEDIPPVDIVFAGMERVLAEVKDVAGTDATVMLYGETGTGKTLVAKILHRLSERKGPFVDINCAAIPENLLESELFGYERGAFTGALGQKKGRFELANDGSILLDEVSEMSLALQAKLLRVLQERSFERLGSLNTLKSNARVIAATNRDLKEMVGGGKFREDLFYRLNVFPIFIPPLRERTESLEKISKYLNAVITRKLGRDPKLLSAAALKMMREYQWPGNIRELENVLERAIIVSKGAELHVSGLGDTTGLRRAQETGGNLKAIEKEAIRNVLSQTKGNRKLAAEMLGISLRSLHYKIREYGIR